MAPGAIMERETGEIPAVVAQALSENRQRIGRLADNLRNRRQVSIVTCARGSSDQAAGYFKYLAEIALGMPVASAGPSIASIYGAPLDFHGRVLLSVSQSGESPDLVAFQAAARAAGAFTIALVNREASPLARGADEVLTIAAGEERSIPATKSAVGAMAVLAGLVAEWSKRADMLRGLEGLAEACDRATVIEWREAKVTLQRASSAYLVGRGPGLPVAMEAALKLKETAAIHAEALSGAEIMHGPLQLVEPRFPVFMFAPRDAAAPSMDQLRARLVATGARVFAAGPEEGEGVVPFAETGCPLLDPISMLTSFYRLARNVACARGYDPDVPSRLAKVTLTV